MNERRIHRLEALIKARAASVLQHEMSDPRLGLVTITRVKLDRELQSCRIYWSVFGDDKLRKLNERTLHHAAGYVQHAIAEVLPTRNVPHVTFEFDESISGAIRVQQILHRLAEERTARGEPDDPDVDPDLSAPGTDPDAPDDADDDQDPEDDPDPSPPTGP